VQTAFVATWGIKAGDKAGFPFLKNGQLWRHDKLRHATTDGSDDWFGQAIIRPDHVLADVRAIVEPSSANSHKFVFFRNIAKGGAANAITMTTAADCKGLKCDAWANQTPRPVLEAVASAGKGLSNTGRASPATPTNGTSAEAGKSAEAGAWHGAALASMAALGTVIVLAA
jgi:hypothetical protein